MGGPYSVALEEAKTGFAEGGIPVGAALVRRGAVLASGRNRRIQQGDPTAHAEIDCLRAAGVQQTYSDVVLYTTHTPCPLCTGAILLFAIPHVVVGDARSFAGEQSLKALRDAGVRVEILNDATANEQMSEFASRHPDIWAADTGQAYQPQ